MEPEFDYYQKRIFKAFESPNCACCDKGTRTHPKYGRFCFEKNTKVYDDSVVDVGDEYLVQLRDGTFVYEYAVKKNLWDNILRGDTDAMKKLKLYFVMEVLQYREEAKKVADTALEEFAYENVCVCVL